MKHLAPTPASAKYAASKLTPSMGDELGCPKHAIPTPRCLNFDRGLRHRPTVLRSGTLGPKPERGLGMQAARSRGFALLCGLGVSVAVSSASATVYCDTGLGGCTASSDPSTAAGYTITVAPSDFSNFAYSS